MISCMNVGAIAAAVKPAIGEVDPYWANVVTMLHGDTLTDSSSQALTLANTGVTVDTTTKKYGTGSLYFNRAAYLRTPYAAGFNTLTGDFTYEAFLYISSNGNLYGGAYGMTLISSMTQIDGFSILIEGSASTIGTGITIEDRINATDLVQPVIPASLQKNTWFHLAVVRSGTSILIFIDGTLVNTLTGFTRSISHSNSYMYYGRSVDVFSWERQFYGYMDEVRFTKGVARYTASFTPPTKAFPNQ